MNKKYIIIAAILVSLIAGVAYANPGIFLARSKTATATTTVEYMTPGTGTTTLSMDAFTLGDNYALDEVALGIQYHASSSVASALTWRFEYSNDNEDWYPENAFDVSNNASSTISVRAHQSYEWFAASSTAGAIQNNFQDFQAFRIVKVPALTRYVRVVFGLKGSPTSNNNGGVWAEFIPVKQRAE